MPCVQAGGARAESQMFVGEAMARTGMASAGKTGAGTESVYRTTPITVPGHASKWTEANSLGNLATCMLMSTV